MFRFRFLCDRESLEVRREAYREAVDDICSSRFGGNRSTMLVLQLGAELQDKAVPRCGYDIFVLTRPNSAGAGCSLPKTAVTFREPGKTACQLELPLSSSLKNIKAALRSAMRPSRRERNGNGVAERDARDCTLIVGGKKMSSSYLLGDYLLIRNSIRRTPTILVLWHPRRQQEPTKATATASRLPRLSFAPVASFATTASAPLLIETQGEGRRVRYLRSRRSVRRRCKGADRFSGLKRGARCGLGIQPLS